MKDIKVIECYEDPEFEKIADDFYGNFTADDWSYIMVAEKPSVAESTIRKAIIKAHPSAIDFQFAKIRGFWMAVSYHS
jgi:hypothetical protein